MTGKRLHNETYTLSFATEGMRSLKRREISIADTMAPSDSGGIEGDIAFPACFMSAKADAPVVSPYNILACAMRVPFCDVLARGADSVQLTNGKQVMSTVNQNTEWFSAALVMEANSLDSHSYALITIIGIDLLYTPYSSESTWIT